MDNGEENEMSEQELSSLPSADGVNAVLDKMMKAKVRPADMDAFRILLDHYPQLVDAMLSLTNQTFDVILKPLAGDNAGALELLQCMRRQKQAELGYGTATPLERLLIEAVTLTWIGYTNVERRASGIWSESHTVSSGEYWDKRVSAAQRRYLRAVETLARVRRLQLPALQGNIGAQQVNQVNAQPRLKAAED